MQLNPSSLAIQLRRSEKVMGLLDLKYKDKSLAGCNKIDVTEMYQVIIHSIFMVFLASSSKQYRTCETKVINNLFMRITVCTG